MNKIKQIPKIFPRMELLGCGQCPYFSEEYEDCRPDWFKCNHPDNEIYDSHIMDVYDWKGKLNRRRLNLKYEYIPFPEGCPLKDKRVRQKSEEL